MIKVSVIVPVYNVEKYLDKCLASLVNQTMKDEMEVIIVNDGSKDGSQSIIDEYCGKYSNFISVEKENGGIGSARNLGISLARGQYIGFVDSDDYVDEIMFEKLYQKAVEQNFDMVLCQTNSIENGKITPIGCGIAHDEDQVENVMCDIYPSVWNRIYKRELFTEKTLFKVGVWFEDVEWTYRLLPWVKSIGVIDGHYYQYIKRAGSITATFNEKLYDYITNLNGIIEYYQKNGFYQKYQKQLEYVYVRYLLATFVKQTSRYDYDGYLKAVKIASENVKQHFPDYRKNKYFYRSLKGLYLVLFSKPLAILYYRIVNIRRVK
ncbi:MAG: glycosyltransferase [Erysipelotrichaceae bacterium]